MFKTEVLQAIQARRLIALARADSAAELQALGTLLRDAGILHLELPLTCPAVPDFIGEALPHLPGLTVGLGTVVDTDSARRAILAGARFLSTPALRPEVILLCRRHHVPVICGAHSDAELAAALEAGADAVKLYPSRDRFGPTHVRETRERFPHARLFPVGGVNPTNVADFLACGADAVFVASGLGFTVDESGRTCSHTTFDLAANARSLLAAVQAATNASPAT